MYIIGSGLAGLLAANILHRKNPVILEKQSMLPNNHKALLRHRDDLISNAVGIPFKEVTVSKQINYKGDRFDKCSIKHGNEYSRKVTGRYQNRSVLNLETAKRYIAPDNFISQLAESSKISLNSDFDSVYDHTNPKIPVISTMPLPSLCKMLGVETDLDFSYKEIHTITANIEIPCDVYQTTYYPSEHLSMYRMSITGDKVIAEFIRPIGEDFIYRGNRMTHEDFICHFLELDFGINSSLVNLKASTSKYGKINDVDSRKRKELLGRITREHNIYSLGRYATWRNILLDDVYHDIQVISNLIKNNGYYTGK